MGEPSTIEQEQCPFLRPRKANTLGSFPTGIYCRLPSGRVRIPSRDGLRRLCTTEDYRDCLVYRRAHAWEITFLGLA